MALLTRLRQATRTVPLVYYRKSMGGILWVTLCQTADYLWRRRVDRPDDGEGSRRGAAINV
jgi:hypothetical protein